MKLVYSIPGKLWWIHNFLPYDMYKGIHDAIIKERDKINLHSVENRWGKSLYENLKLAKRVEVEEYPPFEKLKTLVKHNQYIDLNHMTHMSTNIHYMKKYAGINWHDDNSWKCAATLYINQNGS